LKLEDKWILLQGIFFILIIIVFVSYNSISEKKSVQISNLLKVESNISEANSIMVSNTSKLINHLSGTCPRNRVCYHPSCALWSDINKDGVCDRG
jgi:hypothetical protein